MKKQTLHINLLSGPSTGKCFIKDTKIVMYDGTLKNIQDIVVGDYILGVDSKPKQVLHKHTGMDKMYKINHYKSNSYIVNSEHLITLKRTKGSFYKNDKNEIKKRYPKENDIINIAVKDLLNKSKNFFRSYKGFKVISEFPKTDITLEPYLLGLWLGYGSMDGPTICTADKEIKNHLYLIADKYNLYVREYKKKNNKAIDYRFNSDNKKENKILTSLQDLNLIKNKHIPNVYLFNDKQIRLELLAGLLDSGGCLSNNCFTITQKRKDLSIQIKRLADTLGFKTTIKEITKKSNNINFDGVCYIITISGNIHEIPTKIERKKKKKPNKEIDKYSFGINSIVEYGNDKYYGITVDDEYLLLEDNLVTHNSTIAAQLFAKLKWCNVECELISEYAKEIVWEEVFNRLKNQIYIFAKQHKKHFILENKVDIVITDSPILLSCIYNYDNIEYLNDIVISEHNKLNNLNILLKRTKTYNPNGRTQTFDEALIKDIEIKTFLNNNNIPYIELDATEETIYRIIEEIKKIRPELINE